jgi:hypothetical protein
VREFATKRKLWIVAAVSFTAIAAVSGFIVGADWISEPAPDPAVAKGLLGVTRLGVTAFAGAGPDRCVFSRPDRQLCTWELGGTLITSEDASVTNGVTLLCELPIADEADFEGSCTPHPRIASADLPAVSAGPPSADAPPSGSKGIAVVELDDALQLLELSQRIGAAPDVCRTGGQEQTCIWRLSPEMVTRTFRAVDTGPLELRCTLPTDGSARAAGSCTTARST